MVTGISLFMIFVIIRYYRSDLLSTNFFLFFIFFFKKTNLKPTIKNPRPHPYESKKQIFYRSFIKPFFFWSRVPTSSQKHPFVLDTLLYKLVLQINFTTTRRGDSFQKIGFVNEKQ